jgi:hypothetical protein
MIHVVTNSVQTMPPPRYAFDFLLGRFRTLTVYIYQYQRIPDDLRLHYYTVIKQGEHFH